MEKKLKEMDENEKLQKEVIRKLQISIENLKEEKEELADVAVLSLSWLNSDVLN